MLSNIKDPRHQQALNWFAQNSGQLVSWPQPLEGGTLLVCRPKGIYKPAWSEYAISVRQTLDSTYSDQLALNEGLLKYHQEEQLGRDPKTLFTNIGLEACIRDIVPVGVLVQVSGKPEVRYKILGLARVVGWTNGTFLLEYRP